MRKADLIEESEAAWKRFLICLGRKDQKGMDREINNMHQIAMYLSSKEDQK